MHRYTTSKQSDDTGPYMEETEEGEQAEVDDVNVYRYTVIKQSDDGFHLPQRQLPILRLLHLEPTKSRSPRHR